MNQRKVYCDDDGGNGLTGRRRSNDISPIESSSSRFARTLDNISHLFDKLSAIDENLMDGGSILSPGSVGRDPNSSSVQDRLQQRMERIACGFKGSSTRVDLSRVHRSKSDSQTVDSARIEAFRANDANERCKFLESELAQALDRIRGLNSEKAEASARDRTSRRTHESQQASIATAELQLAKEEIKNLLKVNAGLREKNAALMDMNESQQREMEKLKCRMRTIRTEKAKKEALVDEMARKRVSEAQSARGSVCEIETAMGKLKERLRVSHVDMNSARKENRDMAEQMEELKLHHSATSIAYESCVKENESLREKVKSLEDTLEVKTSELQETFVKIQSFDKSHLRPVSDEVMTSLLSQLADARAEASTARNEAKNAVAQLDALRVKCVLALNREKRNRKDLEDMQARGDCEDQPQALIQSLRDKLQVSSGIYLKRIQKLQGTVNDLNDKVFELERRELKRAPVLVRRPPRNVSIEADDEVCRNQTPVPEETSCLLTVN